MDWIEIIHLRAYSRRDCHAAVTAFHELTLPERETGLKEVALLKNAVIDTDMGIFIYWQGDIPPNGKSGLGVQLSAGFAEYGQINYAVWISDTRLPIHQGAKPDRARKGVFHENRL